MSRYLPLFAIVAVAFAAGVWWRQQRADAAAGTGYGVLLWVPVGTLLAVAVVAALLSFIEP